MRFGVGFPHCSTRNRSCRPKAAPGENVGRLPKKKFEEQLAALEELRGSGVAPATVDRFRKALANRNNYIVAKASKIAGELGLKALIPDLISALDRFFVDPVKSDPQCWAKNAIVQALGTLGHEESAAFIRGLRHVQMEPVWGGQADTAAALRGNCALALVQCRDLSDFSLLSHLIEILVDRDKTVRVEAARAIGRLSRPEAGLLLRLRALTGDDAPEALGACLSALLSIEGRQGIEFVSRFLERRAEDGAEAALALGLMRTPEAVQALKERWSKERDVAFAGVLLSAIALSRQPEAIDFLIHLVETDSTSAVDALGALASAGLPQEMNSRINAAVEGSGNAGLRPHFVKHFS
jgi:HEAT repeat protein